MTERTSMLYSVPKYAKPGSLSWQMPRHICRDVRREGVGGGGNKGDISCKGGGLGDILRGRA